MEQATSPDPLINTFLNIVGHVGLLVFIHKLVCLELLTFLKGALSALSDRIKIARKA